MPLETLDQGPRIQDLVIDPPEPKSARFNPFKELTEEDFAHQVEVINNILEQSQWPASDSDLAQTIYRTRALFPEHDIPFTAPLNLTEHLNSIIRLNFEDGIWTDYLVRLFNLKVIMADTEIKSTASIRQNIFLALKMRLKSNFDDAFICIFYFRYLFHDHIEDLDFIEDDWKFIINTLLPERSQSEDPGMFAIHLSHVRLAFPKEFKRDLMPVDKRIAAALDSGSDFSASILSADDIIIDALGLHLVFNPELKPDVVQEPPEPLKF